MTPTRRTVLRTAGLATLAVGAAACSRPENISDGPATVKSADVPVGSGVIVTNSNYVVTQPTAGTFKAFNRTCPHAGCPVSSVSGTDIVCNCHGSRFSIKDGSAVKGPAEGPLTAAKVSADGGTLTVG